MSQSTSVRIRNWFTATVVNRIARQSWRLVAIGLVIFVLTVSAAQNISLGAQDGSLGSVAFPTTCAPAVGGEFERGVALLHHMMYVEARKTFQDVAERDPECGMAHWGVAMTLFQPLWPTRPGPEELSKGWEAVTKAKELTPESDREQAYIAAVEAFFQEPENADYWARIRRFEQAMQNVYQAFPNDQEAAAFYALSQLATAPQSDDRLAQHARAAEILLEVHLVEPNHPGVVHYTIHANDMNSRENELLDVVRSYDNIAPSVPHALQVTEPKRKTFTGISPTRPPRHGGKPPIDLFSPDISTTRFAKRRVLAVIWLKRTRSALQK